MYDRSHDPHQCCNIQSLSGHCPGGWDLPIEEHVPLSTLYSVSAHGVYSSVIELEPPVAQSIVSIRYVVSTCRGQPLTVNHSTHEDWFIGLR